jgi:protein involved in polysaccharide export with SLBB domain
MTDQQSGQQEQSARTQAQNALNHAHHALDEARHSNVNRDQDIQAAQEQLYKAQQEHLQANVSDSQDKLS